LYQKKVNLTPLNSPFPGELESLSFSLYEREKLYVSPFFKGGLRGI